MIHVAVISPRLIPAILDGSKRVEMRLSVNRQPWHGQVGVGERIYFKARGGAILATALVERVRTYPVATRSDLSAIRGELEHFVLGGSAFWRAKAGARHAVAVWLAAPEPTSFGPALTPGKDYNPRTAWCVLPDAADVYPQCLLEGEEAEDRFFDPLLEQEPVVRSSAPQSSRTGPRPPDARTPHLRHSA